MSVLKRHLPHSPRVLLAVIVAGAMIGAGCTSHAHSTTSAREARLEIAPVKRLTNPPCHAPTVLSEIEEKCATLGAAVAHNADVVDATVVYDSSAANWSLALSLDAAANARFRALGRPGTSVPFVEIAVLVDGRVVEVIPVAGSGQSLQVESARLTRTQAGAMARSITGRTPTVQGGPGDAELALDDHWHVALGVDDCGTWVPNWGWPAGNVTDASAVGAGAPARAGSHGEVYAGLHSHGDGLIHLEPATSAETGTHATLGLYFRYGGWHVSADAIDFVTVHEKNGDLCHGKPGVLRWSVNGAERHGNPADDRLRDGDTIELVFTTADAAMPPASTVPSYASLRQILGDTAP